MKIALFLSLFLLPYISFAQPLKIDCCTDVVQKATIIINTDVNNASPSTSTSASANNTNGVFTFQIATASNTSAGVYNSSDVLIRTLWSGIHCDAGCYQAQWDGLMDDETTAAAAGKYNIRILTNNVQYSWEGVIGNTSDSFTDGQFLNYGGVTALAFTSYGGYLGYGFYEGGHTSRFFSLNNIGTAVDFNAGGRGITMDACTDGKNVYYAVGDQYQNAHYIYAIRSSDNSAVSFANEVSHVVGRENENYTHLIAFRLEDNTLQYSGIAVNQNMIFATCGGKDSLYIFNKNGYLLSRTYLNNPRKLTVAAKSVIWINVNGDFKKYTVDSSGNITDTGVSILSDSGSGIAMTPDSASVSITDVGSSQVRNYLNSTGALQWSLGQHGGYDTNGPKVSFDKFMFKNEEYGLPAIAYQPDGSFWFNDCGNYRVLHFNADRTYKDQIAYVPSSRSTNVDPNDPTRIFADELEFKRDYSKPLDNGKNGSWALNYNWKIGTHLNAFGRFTQVVGFPNGHTYGYGADRDNNTQHFFDLDKTKGAVLITNDFNYATIEADGSKWGRDIVSDANGNYVKVRKNNLIGYSSNYAPQWGTDIIVATSPYITSTNPASNGLNVFGQSTNSDRYFFYNSATMTNNFGRGYRLGSVKANANTWDWESAHVTFYDYTGDYPKDGSWDVGNNNGFVPQHSENSKLLVNGKNLLYEVNGEAWGNGGEINIWNHYNSDGLFIGQFGKTSVDLSFSNSTGFAGNGYSTAVVPFGNDLYAYQCDENSHGGVHSWHITGLNTISEQTVPLTVASAITAVPIAGDLMNGVPYKSPDFYGNSIWTMNPSSNILRPGYGDSYPIWRVVTTHKTFRKDDVDIYWVSDDNTNGTLSANLGNNNTNNWTLSGKLSTDQINNKTFIDVLDANGKIIGTFRLFIGDAYARNVFVNDRVYQQGQIQLLKYILSFADFQFADTNGQLTFSYAGYPAINIGTYDTSADANTPKTLRIRTFGTNDQQHSMGSIKGLRFVAK